MEDGKELVFDVCIVATGAIAKWAALGRGLPPDDGSKESRIQVVQKEGKKLLDFKSVLVVGGRLIGTELAGDIVAYANRKKKSMKVTLVHSGPHLCPEMSEAAAAMVKKKLEKKGVKVFLNEKAVKKDGKWTLGTGETTDANHVVMTVGLSPINNFMTGLGEEGLNEFGFIHTDDYFRVYGCGGKIFSIGDCCMTLPNSGSQVLVNISTIGNNIKVTLDAIAANKPLDNVDGIKKFTKGPEVYLVTVGPKDGVMYSPLLYTQRFFPLAKELHHVFLSRQERTWSNQQIDQHRNLVIIHSQSTC